MWVSYISPSFYAYNALTKNEFGGLDELYITTVVGSDKTKVRTKADNRRTRERKHLTS